MKNFLIIILVLSLSLVGSFSNSYAEVGDFITSFNGTDGTPVEYAKIIGLAVDNTDRIIIIDGLFGTVQIFNSTGAFVTSFDATVGSLAVAVDSNNRIIVADFGLDIVQIYDSNGNFITSFDGTAGGTAFAVPLGVAVDDNDRIIVSDLSLSTVQIFNSNGKFITRIGVTDAEPTYLPKPYEVDEDAVDEDDNIIDDVVLVSPFAVAVDDNDRIIVSDLSLSSIQIFNSTGAFVTSFNGTDGGTAFVKPYAVAVDSNDNIIVADGYLRTIQIFNSTGAFITEFDGSDNGGTNFNVPYAVAVDSNDRIIVGDSRLDIVQIFEGIMEEDIAVDLIKALPLLEQ